MHFVHDIIRARIEAFVAAIRRIFGPKAYVLGAIAIPLVLFSQLANQKGLFELGDANFPWRPFPLDYFLPWQERVAAGVDNVFIGVPRLAYYASINVALAVFRNAQVAQWAWYTAVGALGIIGAYLLARRLSAGVLGFPLALFYAFNLWSYDRLAQPPLFLAYEAAPLAVYLLLRSLDRQRIADYLAFAVSVVLLAPALQIAYLVFALCAAIVLYEIIVRRVSLIALVKLFAVVFVVNGFFLLPMIADFIGRDSNAVGLVAARFSNDIFAGYAARATLLNTLRLASFFYSSLDRQPLAFQWFTLLPAVLMLLAANAVANWRRPAFVASVVLFVTGLWLVAGIGLAPGIYGTFRSMVPGLKLFVEPDYFTPLVILGIFGALATAATHAQRLYGKWWSPAVWLLGLVGIVPLLPFFGPGSGMPQTLIPASYVAFQQTRAPGRVLWLPNLWVARYRWSPYLINGFTVLNSPSDAIGPQMLEWTPPDTLALNDRLVADLETQRTLEAFALMRGFSIGSVAVAADQLSTDGLIPNPLVVRAEASLRALHRDHAVRSMYRFKEPFAELVAVQTTSRLPLVGIYDQPVLVDGSAPKIANLLTLQSRAGMYRPLQTASLARPLTSSAQVCTASVYDVHRVASVWYDVRANVEGTCSLIFRDSFAPAWRVVVTAGQARVHDHFKADGYANGWLITANGPISLRIYHVLAIPYALGLVIAIVAALAYMAGAARLRAARTPSSG